MNGLLDFLQRIHKLLADLLSGQAILVPDGRVDAALDQEGAGGCVEVVASDQMEDRLPASLEGLKGQVGREKDEPSYRGSAGGEGIVRC